MSVADLFKENKSIRPNIYVKDIVVQGQIDLGGDINITGNNGDIFYLQNQELQKLPIGTSGQVLKVNGTENAPVWGPDNAGTGIATELATSDAQVIPLTNTKPSPLAQDQFLGYDEIGAEAIWKQVPAPISLKTATSSVVINTNDPTTPGEVLVYNGLGQAVWDKQEGRANAFINAVGNNIPILPATPQNGQFLRYEQMGGYAEWKNADPPPPDPTVQEVFDAGSATLNMNTIISKGYTNNKSITDATSNVNMFFNTFSSNNAGAINNSIMSNNFSLFQLGAKQFESAYKFYLGTNSATQGTVNALDVDATPDQAVVRNALHVYEQSNVINQYVPLLAETDANEFYNNSGVAVSLSIASSQLIFQNDGDYIEFRSPVKYTGLDILLSVPNSMTFNVRFWNGSFFDNPGVLFDGTNNFTQNGQIRWNLQRGNIKNWQPQGLGNTYDIRIIRNQPVLPVAPSLADNGVKILDRLTNSWDKEGAISTKRADFDENITLGNNNFDTAYGLPSALQPIGSSTQKQNFMMISDDNGNMIFKQSPYLYSNTSFVLNEPITTAPADPTVISTDEGTPEVNGSLTVPPDAFIAGNSFRLEMGGVITLVADDEYIIYVEAVDELGAFVSLAEIFIKPTVASTSKPWKLNANFSIISVVGGVATVADIVDFGFQPDNVGANPQPYETFGASTNNKTVSTTSEQTLRVRMDSTDVNGVISTYVMSVSKKF